MYIKMKEFTVGSTCNFIREICLLSLKRVEEGHNLSDGSGVGDYSSLFFVSKGREGFF